MGSTTGVVGGDTSGAVALVQTGQPANAQANNDAPSHRIRLWARDKKARFVSFKCPPQRCNVIRRRSSAPKNRRNLQGSSIAPRLPRTKILALGACLSISRGRERDGFAFSRGGADEVGFDPNEKATTTNEGKRPLPKGWQGEGRLRCCAACPWNPPPTAPRALHPLPLPANAAHAEYSDRLQG